MGESEDDVQLLLMAVPRIRTIPQFPCASLAHSLRGLLGLSSGRRDKQLQPRQPLFQFGDLLFLSFTDLGLRLCAMVLLLHLAQQQDR